ncbi:TetR/AcrR family transcriptional regulator [Streptomyces sp. NPDC049970]|uniref:TetR/AcrR family transcriptional regulator n=1 Tax=Streptomyces sp. NPDC049970 TaxID=3155033 RepID=UPI00342559DB
MRADILAAATGLIDRGDERTPTLRAVARQAGIAVPSIYPHFADRPAIMLALVREAFDELSGRLVSAVDAAGDDAEDRLYAACTAYLDYADAHPERYRAMCGEMAHPAAGGTAGQDLASLGAQTLRILVATLTDCVTAGCSTSTDPWADAIALRAGLHGLAHQRSVAHVHARPGDLVRPIAASLSRLGPGRATS